MKQYKLHYSSLGSSSDAIVFEVRNLEQLIDKIDELTYQKNDRVWLLAKGKSSFVTEHKLELQEIISKKAMVDFWTVGEYHLQEWGSFEDAYSVALHMKEFQSPNLAYSSKALIEGERVSD